MGLGEGTGTAASLYTWEYLMWCLFCKNKSSLPPPKKIEQNHVHETTLQA